MSALASNRLVARLCALRAAEEGGVAPYITAGDGGPARTLAVLHGLEAGGAVCVELGVPFSDPIADGPRLQAAAARALEAGTTLDGVCEVVQRYRGAGGALPIVAFSYLNPLLAGGLTRRLAQLARAGVDGLLAPDVPLEEAAPVQEAARAAGLALCLFVAPTSSDERARAAAAASDGFLYVVGRTGVTGASTEVGAGATDYLARVRALAGDTPLGVGFGIRAADQVAAVLRNAELAVVGTALVEHLHEVATSAAARGEDPDSAAGRAAERFLRDLSTTSLPA